MNILYICHRIPYPPNKGDKIRSFNEIKYLSKKHDISLVCLVDNKKDLIYIDELKKYCKTIDYDVIKPNRQKIKSLAYLFSKSPLSVPYFYSRKLQRAVEYRLSIVKFDAVFAFSSPMAEYVFKSKAISNNNAQVRLIMDFVDVDSDKWRMYSEHSFFPKSLIYKNEWKRLMAYERKIAEIFDVSVFVSDAEAELFKSIAPNVKSVSIPNGVDFEYFRDVRNVHSEALGQDIRTNEVIERAERSNGLNILFTGAMDYFPNEDGVLFFYNESWSHIKDKLPQARFYIVGDNPSRRIKNIAKRDKDVIVTGYVSDVRDYFSIANIFIAPLRVARGIQNKVLEALAAGLPVVATSVAVQGIGCNGDGFLFIEDSPLKFAERTVELAKRQLSNDVNEKRESFLKQKFSWKENFEKLGLIIEKNGGIKC